MPSISNYPPGIKVSRKAADGAVSATPGKLWGVVLTTTTAESYVDLHDAANDSTAGNIILACQAAGGTATGRSNSAFLPRPIDFAKLYAGVNGSGAVAYVYYQTAVDYAS